jgi:hypothetical protein
VKTKPRAAAAEPRVDCRSTRDSVVADLPREKAKRETHIVSRKTHEQILCGKAQQRAGELTAGRRTQRQENQSGPAPGVGRESTTDKPCTCTGDRSRAMAHGPETETGGG